MNKLFLNFDEFIEQYNQRPAVQYLWGGIPNNSFGFIFGPSKSGKTIFCENLAMSFAIGRHDFMGQDMNIKPQKVLIVGLEEFWANRAERNAKQFQALNDEEKLLVRRNLMVQHTDFQKYITCNDDWKKLKALIEQSGAETVIIDSLTRLNHSTIEESSVGQEITSKLRAIKDELEINLFVIHHSTKNQKNGMSMDSMAGTRVFAQEADFAISISKVESKSGVKHRYMKQIFYRYAADDFETVSVFEINPENIWLEYKGETNEQDLVQGKDLRINPQKEDAIKGYFQENKTTTITKNQLITKFVTNSTMSERSLEYKLKELVNSEFLTQPKKGEYLFK